MPRTLPRSEEEGRSCTRPRRLLSPTTPRAVPFYCKCGVLGRGVQSRSEDFCCTYAARLLHDCCTTAARSIPRRSSPRGKFGDIDVLPRLDARSRTNAFSKKVENVAAGISVHFMHCNSADLTRASASPVNRLGRPRWRQGFTDHVLSDEARLAEVRPSLARP